MSVALFAALVAPVVYAQEGAAPPAASGSEGPAQGPSSPDGGAPPSPPPAEPAAEPAPVQPVAAQPAEPEGFLAGAGLTGTEDLRVRWWQIPDALEGFEDRPILDYVEVVQRLDLRADTAEWGVGARADVVALFGNRYILDGVLYHERDLTAPGLESPFDDAFLNLEKMYVERRGPSGTLTLGDSYVSFGRGMALNLVKSTEIDVDTSLRGLRGTARGATRF